MTYHHTLYALAKTGMYTVDSPRIDNLAMSLTYRKPYSEYSVDKIQNIVNKIFEYQRKHMPRSGLIR